MGCKNLEKVELRRKRCLRVRKNLRGTAACPRMCVVKSNKHLQVQLIDDEAGQTVVGLSTCDKELRASGLGRINKEAARKLGTVVGERAKQKSIERVVFDRGWAKYHGVVKELADAARAAGLQF